MLKRLHLFVIINYYLFNLVLLIHFNFDRIVFIMFILFLNTSILQFLNLNIQVKNHFYFHHQRRCLDQSPFITHIVKYFSSNHLNILSSSLKREVGVISIKLFRGKIHFILFFHLFHKVYLKVLSLKKR
jgi:hypothetical protein